MINDQALLHLMARMEHERVVLEDLLRQRDAKIAELEARVEAETRVDRDAPDRG